VDSVSRRLLRLEESWVTDHGYPAETIGYAGRAISADQPFNDWTLGPFIVQSLLLLIAPAFLAASVYMQLGRIVQLLEADGRLFIRRTWLTKIFVCRDVLSFLVQGSGGGLMAGKSLDSVHTGVNLVISGLFIQVVFFGIFLLATITFQLRLRAQPTPRSQSLPWKKHIYALYSVSALIFLRCLVRVVEYLEGYGGWIMSHEVMLYVFDGALMFLCMLIWNWIHPSEVRSLLLGGFAFKGYRLEKIEVEEHGNAALV
jgi:hypothetical protein